MSITWFCAQALFIIHNITDTHKYEAASKVEQQPQLSLEGQTLGHARDEQITKVEKEGLIQAKCEYKLLYVCSLCNL